MRRVLGVLFGPQHETSCGRADTTSHFVTGEWAGGRDLLVAAARIPPLISSPEN